MYREIYAIVVVVIFVTVITVKYHNMEFLEIDEVTNSMETWAKDTARYIINTNNFK